MLQKQRYNNLSNYKSYVPRIVSSVVISLCSTNAKGKVSSVPNLLAARVFPERTTLRSGHFANVTFLTTLSLRSQGSSLQSSLQSIGFTKFRFTSIDYQCYRQQAPQLGLNLLQDQLRLTQNVLLEQLFQYVCRQRQFRLTDCPSPPVS